MPTLNDILNLMPQVMLGRYQKERFWVPTANIVLSEIERNSDSHKFYIEDLLLLKRRVSEYAVPDKLRSVRSLRAVVGSEIQTFKDKVGEVRYELSEDLIKLHGGAPALYGYSTEEPDKVPDIDGTIKYVVDNRIYSADLIDPVASNKLLSWALEIHKDESTVTNEFKITSSAEGTSEFDLAGDVTTQTITPTTSFIASSLIGNTDDLANFYVSITFADGTIENFQSTSFDSGTGEVVINGTATQNITILDTFTLSLGWVQWNGVFKSDPVSATALVPGKAFHVTPNFYVIQGYKKCTRFTIENINTLEVDLPFDWYRLLRDGIRFYGELQTDRDGKQSASSFHENRYNITMQNFIEYFRRPEGDQAQLYPDDEWFSLEVSTHLHGKDKSGTSSCDYGEF